MTLVGSWTQIVLVLSSLTSSPAPTGETEPLVPATAVLQDEATLPKAIQKHLDEAAAPEKKALVDPALSDRVLEAVNDGRLARLFEDLHVQFKTFERDSGGDPALGFEYDFAKSLTGKATMDGWSLDVVAKGNVAFDQSVNPDDFLSTSVRARWFGSFTNNSSSPTSRTAKAGEATTPPRQELVRAFMKKFREAGDTIPDDLAGPAVRALPMYKELEHGYLKDVKGTLPPEFFYDFDVHVGLESNQDFSSRQSVFGALIGGRLVSWNQDAALSRLNVFDFPAAAARWLVGEQEEFTPSGEAYPTIVAGLDLVDGSDDDVRSAVTDDESYLRARIEAGMKSRLVRLEDSALFLSVGWRFYQEIDAPASVRRADIDEFDHFQVRLDLPKGWALTYAAGKLPLDGQDDSTFSLGYNVQF